jgi:hypothetical protein
MICPVCNKEITCRGEMLTGVHSGIHTVWNYHADLTFCTYEYPGSMPTGFDSPIVRWP